MCLEVNAGTEMVRMSPITGSRVLIVMARR